MEDIKKFEATVIDTFEKIEAQKLKLENQLKAEPDNPELQEQAESFNKIYEQAVELKRITEKYSKTQ